MQGNIRKPQTVSGNISTSTITGSINGEVTPKSNVSVLVNKDFGEKLEGISTETANTIVNHVLHTIAVNVNTDKFATKDFCSKQFQTNLAAETTKAQLTKLINDIDIEVTNKIRSIDNFTTQAVNAISNKVDTSVTDLTAQVNTAVLISKNVESFVNENVTKLSNELSSLEVNTKKAIDELTVNFNNDINNTKQEFDIKLNNITEIFNKEILNITTKFAADLSYLDKKFKTQLTYQEETLTALINNNITNITSDLTDLEKSVNQSISNLSYSINKNIEVINKSLESYAKSIEQINISVNQINNYLSDYQERINKNSSEIKDLKDNTTILGNKIIQTNNDLWALNKKTNQDINSINLELSSQANKLKETENKLNNLQISTSYNINNINTELTNQAINISKTATNLDNLQKNISTQYTNINNQLNSLDKKIDTANSAFEDKLIITNNAVQTNKNEIDATKTDLADNVQTLNTKLTLKQDNLTAGAHLEITPDNEIRITDFPSSVNIFQLTNIQELETLTATHGDIAVITTPITDGKNSISTYVYDETEKWIAADGSYSAENVYFKDDLTMTFDFGKYKANGKSVKIPAANKNVKGLLLDAFAEEKEPVITNPYIALSLNDTADSVEIGTNFSKSLTATATYYDGKYSYGYVGAKNGDTASNNILSNYSISNNKTADTSTSNKLTTTFTVNKIDKTHSITFTGNASYGASNRIPVTNIENPREDKKILAGTTTSKTATFNVSVFRYSFKYVGTNLDPIDNNWMRTIADKTTANLKSVSLTIPVGTKRVVVALPGTHTLQKVIDVKGMGLDVKGTFDTRTLNIEGANGYTAVPYTIFVKENVNGLAATTYNFTIS